jgi:hypothetical protein
MKRVAVLGASSKRWKFGNKSLRAHLAAGWEAIPVNDHETEIEGVPVARSLAEIPPPLDRVTVYLHPEASLAMLPAIAAAAPRDVFFNPGSADGAVFAEAARLGLNAIGGCSIVDLGFDPSDFP